MEPVIKSTFYKQGTMINISRYAQELVTTAVRKAFPLPNFVSSVSWSHTPDCDLSSPSAMQIFNMNKSKKEWTIPSSKEVANEIITQLDKSEIFKSFYANQMISVDNKPKKKKGGDSNKDDSNPGSFFINITLSDDWIETFASKLLKEGISVTQQIDKKKIIVDFSSPNIAKEMHVGHLRSTIQGDVICRLLEYLGHEVIRQNHVGDWGTQFGMLITYLEELHPNYLEDKPEIKDLEAFYIAAKKKFDDKEGTDPNFKKKAYENTVKLQSGDEICRKSWTFICDVSRKEFNKIYDKLDIHLEEKGESFYDPICRQIVKDLTEKDILKKDDGAMIISVGGIKTPMMIVKSDGGLTYDTTDLAAIHYRFNELKANWIIYVVGNEQELHLKLLFECAKLLKWHDPPKTRCNHMGFGLMLNEEGKKFSTRKGGNIKLAELLDEAKERAKKELQIRNEEHKTGFTEEYIDLAAESIGYGAVKYFDLKQNRISQYKFGYNLILDPKGNTAVYLFYSYVRICSIFSKAKMSDEDIKKLIDTEKIKISNRKERDLIIALFKFNDTIDDILDDLNLNKLTDYLYHIAVKFSEFYTDDNCQILGNEHTNSRLLIIELTKRFMQVSFNLLGLKPIEKI